MLSAAGVGLYAPLAAGVRRLAEWVRDEAAAAPQEGDGRGHRTILHGPQVALPTCARTYHVKHISCLVQEGVHAKSIMQICGIACLDDRSDHGHC